MHTKKQNHSSLDRAVYDDELMVVKPPSDASTSHSLRQNVLAMIVLLCSLGGSVALGYAINESIQPVSKHDVTAVKSERPTKSWNFNHLLALLVPELG